jgi:hypothetical protein
LKLQLKRGFAFSSFLLFRIQSLSKPKNCRLIRLREFCQTFACRFSSVTCSLFPHYTPDLIIADLKPTGNIPDPQRIQNHTGYLSDYLAQLQDDGLKPGAVENYIKTVRTFYRVNGIKIELTEPLSRRVVYKDRAPKPDELATMLDLTNLRGKVIVSCLALGAFREETFTKLTYRHVKEDLEAGITPIHLHIEAEITKGKYHDYDTFLGSEAA